VLDLGAGAGGPARVLLEAMVRSDSSAVPRFVLTDLAPMPEVWAELEAAWPSRMASVPTPVDATAIDPKIAEGRARVIINVLHHFPPAVARGVFADAIAQGSPIFISESFGREPWQFLVNFPPTGIPALLTAPLLTPRRRLAKAALVWWTPLGALASAWDGLVSTLRVYEEDELRAMVASIPGHEQFRWVFGRYPYPPLGRGLFFYGIPHS
ncbi:MAG: class I SAM-dependent methyltransferase, partial [Myxococcota bacterium]